MSEPMSDEDFAEWDRVVAAEDLARRLDPEAFEPGAFYAPGRALFADRRRTARINAWVELEGVPPTTPEER